MFSLFGVFGVPELEICLRRPPATLKLENLIETTKASFLLFIPRLSLGMKNPKTPKTKQLENNNF